MPAEAPRRHDALDVPGFAAVSPSTPQATGGIDGDRWVLAEEHRTLTRATGYSTYVLPEVWHQQGDAWSVTRPLRWGEAIGGLAIDHDVVYAGLTGSRGGLLVGTDGTWVDAGTGPTDLPGLDGVFLLGGEPWLLHGNELSRHSKGATTPDRTIRFAPGYSNAGAGLSALAEDDLWIAKGSRVVHVVDGGVVNAWDLATPLESVWAFSAIDVWAVGWDGAWHWDGRAWTQLDAGITPRCPSSTQRSLRAIAGAAPDDVWAVGGSCSHDPQIAHWDGTAWTSWSHAFFRTGHLTGLLVRSSTDVYVIGSGVYHWNGRWWSELPRPGATVTAIAATETTLWIGDENGTIYERAIGEP